MALMSGLSCSRSNLARTRKLMRRFLAEFI